MKKIIIMALLVLALLPACQKKGLPLFVGDYSYKMSGSVVLTPADNDELDTLTFNITTEIGNLNISTFDKDNDSVVLVMNPMNGELSTTRAYCCDTEIKFAEYKKSLRLTNIAEGISALCDVNVKANGIMYDGNTIVVNMEFSGMHTYLDNEYGICGDDILFVAYRND